MASKVKAPSVSAIKKPKVSRPNVHAKTKMSKLKSSKNYTKMYKRQGR